MTPDERAELLTPTALPIPALAEFRKMIAAQIREAEKGAVNEYVAKNAANMFLSYQKAKEEGRASMKEEAAKVCDEECFCPIRPCLIKAHHDIECNACYCAINIRAIATEVRE